MQNGRQINILLNIPKEKNEFHACVKDEVEDIFPSERHMCAGFTFPAWREV